MALRFAVELRAKCTLDAATTTARLESRGFRLIGSGLGSVADAIDVRVTGALRPSAPDARLCALSGDVSFVASGALPDVLRAAPEPARDTSETPPAPDTQPHHRTQPFASVIGHSAP